MFEILKPFVREKIDEAKRSNYGLDNDTVAARIREQLLGRLLPQCYAGELDQYINEVLEEYSNTVLSVEGLTTTPDSNALWLLPATLNAIPNNYWNVYRENARNFMHLSDDDIGELETVSLRIVNYLTPPACSYDDNNPLLFKKKGLVYGNVQSGKTSSMAAVISQYVTMGCNLVIVLSGIHNNLWEQTQSRLIRDLGIDDQNNYLPWRLITAVSDNIPEDAVNLRQDMNLHGCIIGVFKKNSRILGNLLTNYLQEPSDELNRGFLTGVKALIIDDECDQAGINVSQDENERTAINDCIVRMFRYFPRFAYIGYTATPFANVLSEGPGEESMYPSDFITMLPEKKDYFGAAKIFGKGEEFENYKENDPTLDIVMDMGACDNHNIDFDSIEMAVKYYILAVAVKRIRAEHLNDLNLLRSHSTMMIHTSERIEQHRDVYDRVRVLLRKIREEWDTSYNKNSFREIWNNVYLDKRRRNLEAISALFSTPVEDLYVPAHFDEIYNEAAEVLYQIKVRIDNGNAAPEERLSYDENATGCFIAVGGNTMSRGLTLQGLIVAVFARRVNTYDTLLQMGRWFGYRKRYEDLVRLWMTQDAKDKMRFLAGVEMELRDSIEKYGLGATPRTLAIAIRTRPNMQIVRKLAMRGAVTASVNLTGRRPQTVFFRNDEEWLKNNINAVKTIVRSNADRFRGLINGEAFLFENIGIDSFRTFISNYKFYEKTTDGLNSALLLRFIDTAREQNYINNWNLVVKTVSSGVNTRSDTEIIPGQTVNLLNRGKVDDRTPDRLYLKAVASPWDIVCDIEGAPQLVNDNNNSSNWAFEYRNTSGRGSTGLVVVYPIYAKGQGTSSNRVPLEARADVYALSIIFPKPVNNSSDFIERVSIRLDDDVMDVQEDYIDDSV